MKTVLKIATLLGALALGSTSLQAGPMISGTITFNGPATFYDGVALSGNTVTDLNQAASVGFGNTSSLEDIVNTTTATATSTAAILSQYIPGFDANAYITGELAKIDPLYTALNTANTGAGQGVISVQSSNGTFLAEGLGDGNNPTNGFDDFVVMNAFTFNPADYSSPVASPLWAGGGFDFDLNTITSVITTSSSLTIIGQGKAFHANYDDSPGTWAFTTQAGAVGSEFTFSASTTAVPEPSTVALMGMAFVGLGFVGYRKRRAA